MLDVSLKYIVLNNSHTLLRDINFRLEKNQIFTILGKNGSGKSTLIKSLTNLLDKRFYSVEGKVLFKGKDILALSGEQLLEIRRNQIKYVFQDSVNSFDHLKKFSYYFERLALNEDEIDGLLKYLLLPGYEELSRRYAYEVSDGMAQRINFAIALLSKPKIIILDEPTSGIDPAIANLFLLRLKEYVKNDENTVLLVTHDLIFAKSISDKIAFLSDGELSDFYLTDDFFKASAISELNGFLTAHKKLNI